MNPIGKILIVEDDPDINTLISYNLAKEGFESDSVFDGRSAMNILANGFYDVVILDIILPGVDGLSICKHIRNDGRYFNTIIIMLTALHEPKDKLYANILGADMYFTKPFNVNEVLLAIKEMREIKLKPHTVCSPIVLQG